MGTGREHSRRGIRGHGYDPCYFLTVGCGAYRTAFMIGGAIGSALAAKKAATTLGFVVDWENFWGFQGERRGLLAGRKASSTMGRIYPTLFGKFYWRQMVAWLAWGIHGCYGWALVVRRPAANSESCGDYAGGGEITSLWLFFYYGTFAVIVSDGRRFKKGGRCGKKTHAVPACTGLGLLGGACCGDVEFTWMGQRSTIAQKFERRRRTYTEGPMIAAVVLVCDDYVLAVHGGVPWRRAFSFLYLLEEDGSWGCRWRGALGGRSMGSNGLGF